MRGNLFIYVIHMHHGEELIKICFNRVEKKNVFLFLRIALWGG